MENFLFFVIAIGIFVALLILFKPIAGLVLMILYISMAVFPRVSSSLFGIFSSLSLIKLLGGLTFVSVLIHNIFDRKKVRIFQHKQSKFFLFLLLWVAISGFTQPCSFTRESFTRYASFAMLFYTVAYLVDSPARFKLVLWSCIISMLWASGLAISQYISAGGAIVRAGGTFIDSNYFNLYILPIIPVACYRISDERMWGKKLLAAAAFIMLILAVVLTFSRGGMVGLAVILFLLALNSRRKLFSFLILGIIITIFLTHMPEHFRERMERTDIELKEENPDSSTYRRLLLTKAGWRMLLDNPLTGVGIGNFYWSVKDYAPVHPGLAHNMYIEVAAELGLIGIFLFMGIIFFTLKDLRGIIKSRSPALRNYAQGIYVGFAGFLAAALFLHGQYEKFFWLFIFLTVCLRKLADKKEIEIASPLRGSQ